MNAIRVNGPETPIDEGIIVLTPCSATASTRWLRTVSQESRHITTKSVSQFVRNTVDSLTVVHQLKKNGV